MATKTLGEIRRGDKITTPKGPVTVTSFRENWEEEFGKGHYHGPTTMTIEGTLKGKKVRMTAPKTQTVEVEA